MFRKRKVLIITCMVAVVLVVMLSLFYNLIKTKPFLSNAKLHKTLQEAIDSIGHEGTISVLSDIQFIEHGIEVSGKSVKIKLHGHDVHIHVNDNNALSIRESGSLVSTDGTWYLRTDNSGSSALYVDGNSSAHVKGQIETFGRYTNGITASPNGQALLDGSVNVSGDNCYGVFANIESIIEVSGNVDVKGDYSFGVYSGGNSSVKISGSLKATGTETYAIDSNPGAVEVGKDIVSNNDNMIWYRSEGKFHEK